MSSAPLHEVPHLKTAPVRDASAAAEALYERYYDRVFGFCLYQLGNREEAEDAAQTTFLSALRALERGVVPQMEANWLFTIARNACRARFRTRGLSRERETLSDPHILEAVCPDREASGDQLFSLEEALADMPDQQRRAIVLREWRGCSYAEIADELGLSAAAVETLIFRARRSLAQRLEHPPVSTRRAGILSGFSWFGASIKGLLGLGGAKVVAAVAVGALAISFGVSSDVEHRTPAPHSVPPAQSGQVVVTPPATDSTGPVEPGERPPVEVRNAGPKSSAPKKDGALPPTIVDDPVGTITDPVTKGPLGETVGGITDDLNGTVDEVEGTVDDLVDGVEDTVNPLLPPEAQLPDVELPDIELPDLLN